jgi:uncharacterized protein
MIFNKFYTFLITVPMTSFVLAVFLKWVSERLKKWKWNIERAFWSGWMPSVHSAVVVSLSMAIALKYGVKSDWFAIMVAFSSLIIYDAINVRFEAGLHAEAINEAIGEKKFKESLGHLPSEAFAGSVLGIIVAIVLYYI